MKVVSLDKLRISGSDHQSALRWLGILYRKPNLFNQSLIGPPRKIVTATLLVDPGPADNHPPLRPWTVTLRLWAHAIPYILLVACIRWMIISDTLVVELAPFGIAAGFIIGLIIALLSGFVAGPSGRVAPFIIFGMAGAATYGLLPNDLIFATVWGIAFGIFCGITSAIRQENIFNSAIAIFAISVFVVLMARNTDMPTGWFFASSLGGVACQVAFLRLYYYPLHLLILLIKKPSLYRFHPVAWDDFCPVPFVGLDQLLIGYARQNPFAAKKEIERLIVACPWQRTAVLRAWIMLLARESAQVLDLTRLDEILVKLPGGETGFLQETVQIQQGMSEISRLQTRLNTVDRPLFRELNAQLLVSRIENFQSRIVGFHDPIAGTFRVASEKWRQIALRQLKEAQTLKSQKPLQQVFRAGDPIDRDTEAFVLRSSVAGALEQQITLSTGCPGILLYGRRRMGKSTVLRNLEGFLPGNVLCVALSMQNPQMFASLQHFAEYVMAQISSATRFNGTAHDLATLFAFLELTNKRLYAEDNRLLVAIDEYEIIDRKIREGIFSQDLLDMLRESIQMHRRITWLFAGSREITELQGAPWGSYLLSTRTVEVPGFTPDETRLLLTEPLKYSSFWRNRQNRPAFEVGFWGQGGIEHIHSQSGGWPVLVQLIAETAIDILNEENKQSVATDVLDRSLRRCVVKGDTVLSQLMRGESTLPGEWEYLCSFRTHDVQPPPSDEAIFRSLRHRRLVISDNGDWRLRVPLMGLWLRERG